MCKVKIQNKHRNRVSADHKGKNVNNLILMLLLDLKIISCTCKILKYNSSMDKLFIYRKNYNKFKDKLAGSEQNSLRNLNKSKANNKNIKLFTVFRGIFGE